MTEQKQNQQRSNWPLEDIRVPGDHDVIFGRGGASIHHAGCKAYRELVRSHQRQYIGYDDSRHMKTLLTHELVKKWRDDQSPPGRFLKKDEKTGLWHDVGVKIARRKTAQLLREGAKQVRKEMRAETEASSSSSSSEDENEEYAGSLPAKKKQKRDQPNQQESMCSTPPSLPRQSPVPVTPPGATIASTFHPGMMMMAQPPTSRFSAPPAIPPPAPMEVTTSGVHLANLQADLKSLARTAPPTVFSSSYGQPKNSTEMLEIIFEDILDDTANPQQATSS